MALRTSLVAQPHLYMGDTTGRPLDGGKVYFGQADKDPELYPINIFYDEDLTIAAPQPVRSKGGFMNANGQITEVYAAELSYSVKVLDSYGRQVFYQARMSRENTSAAITTELPYIGAVTRSQKSKNSDILNINDFSGVGENKVQAAINYMPQSVIRSGNLNFNAGEQLDLSNTIFVLDARVDINGRNGIMKWTGAVADAAMIEVSDSTYTKVRDLVLIGNSTNPPLAAIRFKGLAGGGSTGTNEKISVTDVLIGRKYGKDTDGGGSINTGTPYGLVQNGLLWDGIDGNNDEFYINNVTVNEASVAGFNFNNSQSIWTTVNNSLANGCDIGYRLGCNMTMYNVQSNRNKTADLYGIRNIEVNVVGFFSEHGKVFVKSDAGASFYIKGGKCMKVSNIDDERFFELNSGGSLVVEGLTVVNNGTGKNVVYARAGSTKSGVLRFKDNSITLGDKRDTWDISTDSPAAKKLVVDIEHDDFHFKTSAPYFDATLPAITLASKAKSGTGTGVSANNTSTRFINYVLSKPIGDVQLVKTMSNAALHRPSLFNRGTSSVTIEDARIRAMDMTDYLLQQKGFSVDFGVTAAKSTVIKKIGLMGVQLGDCVELAINDIYNSMGYYAYVSAQNEISICAESAWGVSQTLPLQNFRVAKINDAKFRYFGYLEITPITISPDTLQTYNISVKGAQVGAHCYVSFYTDIKGLCATAHVEADNSVRINIFNNTGAAITLESTALKVSVVF